MDTAVDPRLDGLPDTQTHSPTLQQSQQKHRAPKLRRKGQPPPEWAPEDLTHSPEDNNHEIAPDPPARSGEWDVGNPDADPSSELAHSSSGSNSTNNAQISRQATIIDESPERHDRDMVQFNDVQDTVGSRGDLVRDVSSKTMNSAGETTQNLVGAVSHAGDVAGAGNEQLKLRLDLNLDVELQLKAKIRGDLTLQLMS